MVTIWPSLDQRIYRERPGTRKILRIAVLEGSLSQMRREGEHVRKLIVVLAVASVTAVGTALALPSVAATAAASPSASIKWGNCSDPNLKQMHA